MKKVLVCGTRNFANLLNVVLLNIKFAQESTQKDTKLTNISHVTILAHQEQENDQQLTNF